jgi:hypothetical protein
MFAVSLTNLSVKRGLQLYGDEAHQAIVAEMAQLHNKNVFEGVKYNTLNAKQKRKILKTLMFLKKKRDGRMKARACVDGRKQSMFELETDPASPTVSLESLMLSCVIDANERRHVVTADIEGAYLAVDIDEEVIIELDQVLADVLTSVDSSKYSQYVHEHNGSSKMYLKLNKALYGCVQSARLFYNHLSNTLNSFGFVANPYDKCVFNKVINDVQCTVLIYVDDIKISSTDIESINTVVKELTRVYKKVNVNNGQLQSYLGMTIDYTENGTVKFSMDEMIQECLGAFGESLESMAAKTPAANHLFAVNEDCEKLSEQLREKFHSIVAKLLYVAKRVRPDILTAISFLSRRVRVADMDDWKKLKRLLSYLNGSKHLKLRLTALSMNVIECYVDASFAIHDDMKGHTGSIITMGGSKGAVFAKSTKQRIVAKSSTEAELVAVSDSLPQVIWTRNFLKEQGYDIPQAILYQDNQSCIMLSEKGKTVSQRTRHINIRYFFIQDRVATGEVKLVYKRTEDMLADFFTKPLQGSLFLKHRKDIMNE